MPALATRHLLHRASPTCTWRFGASRSRRLASRIFFLPPFPLKSLTLPSSRSHSPSSPACGACVRQLPVLPAHQRREVPLRLLPLLPALLLGGRAAPRSPHLVEEQPGHRCLCGLSSRRGLGCLRLCSPSFCSSFGPAPAFSVIFSSKPGRQLLGAALAPRSPGSSHAGAVPGHPKQTVWARPSAVAAAGFLV